MADTSNQADAAPDRSPLTGDPRWVKVFGIVVVVLILLLLVVLLTGGGDHGPGRHAADLSSDHSRLDDLG